MRTFDLLTSLSEWGSILSKTNCDILFIAAIIDADYSRAEVAADARRSE
jgi:hypothetical protein